MSANCVNRAIKAKTVTAELDKWNMKNANFSSKLKECIDFLFARPLSSLMGKFFTLKN